MKIKFGILVFFLVQHSNVWAKSFESGENKVSVIELYSSEGCSSCPPADKWMAKLKNHSDLWKKFIPINFHVDYWNYLGWNDRFSHKKFTNRQHRYASEWNVKTVYTPAFVLDGANWKSRDFSKIKNQTVGNLKVEVLEEDQTYKLIFKPTKNIASGYVGHAALLGSGLSTTVKNGENAGETLKHEFVVLGLNKVNLNSSKGAFDAIIKKPSSTAKGVKNYKLVFWVSNTQSQKPIQALALP